VISIIIVVKLSSRLICLMFGLLLVRMLWLIVCCIVNGIMICFVVVIIVSVSVILSLCCSLGDSCMLRRRVLRVVGWSAVLICVFMSMFFWFFVGFCFVCILFWIWWCARFYV